MTKLGYAILASYQAQGSHLFGITYRNFRYEFDYDGEALERLENKIKEVVPPNVAKLSSLKLKVGDMMETEYDYGAGRIFPIRLLSMSPMVHPMLCTVRGSREGLQKFDTALFNALYKADIRQLQDAYEAFDE